MWLRDIVANRFKVEQPIGSGGTASVFLATDIIEGRPVAVKVLDLSTEDAVERFRREVRVLSELSHPGIVRYIAHGETTARQSFLVMEFLEGEDLAKRLTRGGLSVEESLALIRRAAEALAFAHGKGIVHRDIKPSNLFLVGGDVERLKVLDFGIARAALQTGGLTQTGAMLGTVGYMAPEQAMGSRDVDVRADVFALGCVLFECLTGKAAFAGQHAIAVLAKVLSEQAPRISELRADLSGPLDDLVARMLAKNRADRPRDLSEIVSALSEIRSCVPTGTRALIRREPATLTHSEQRIVSVILAEPSQHSARGGPTTLGEDSHDLALVRQLAERTGIELTPLGGGALVLVVTGRGTASDQAAQAATCALSLTRLSPNLRVALATGRGETGNRLPVGPAIDRAAALLRARGQRTETPCDGILVDDVTVALLAARFEVRQASGENVLVGERAEPDAPRLLMGRPTPTVGRDKELAILEATLTECIDDSVARAVLVTAPPGVGKSRLASEFLRRGGARARVLTARADATSAGSALALAQRLVLQALGLRSEASFVAQRDRLHEYVHERVAPDRADLVAEFLAEIAGIAGDGSPSPYLRAARNDAAIMQEQKRRAFEVFIDAQVASGPLLIVLEDLHWGDVPTVRYLEDALRRLTDRPLMVLALGRPEVHEHFPRLWDAVGLQEIRLGGLSRKAAERLVRAVLSEATEPSLVARVVERADGNAFYLEELIRHVAEGDSTLPETVLAMAQFRLERLEPEARRVLRAASVYGERCWSRAVAALLDSGLDTAGWLDALTDRELLVRSRESRFAGEDEYVFRHALLRDAAYAMLTEEDRKNAHSHAAAWLEAAGEKDGTVLADHFERSGNLGRAIPWICLAAETALSSGDLPGAIDLARRGQFFGAADESRGRLLAIEAFANVFRSQPSISIMREAIGLLPEGSTLWWAAVSGALLEAAITGGSNQAAEFVQLALATRPSDELTGPYGMAIGTVVAVLVTIGHAEMANAILAPFEGMEADDPRCDPVFVAFVDGARCQYALSNLQDGSWPIERAIRLAEKSAAAMASCGAITGESYALFYEAVAKSHCGLLIEAEAAAKRSALLAKQTGLELIQRYATLWDAFAQIRTGRLDDAVTQLSSLQGHLTPLVEQLRQIFLADALRRQGASARALAEAHAATTGPSPRYVAMAASVLARIHLELGEPEECLRIPEILGSPFLSFAADLSASKAIALRDLGRDAEARALLANARQVVVGAAHGIEDPEIRQAFLVNVDECARTLALWREWFGETG